MNTVVRKQFELSNFTKYYEVDQVKGDEMGRTMWLDEKCWKTLGIVILKLLTY
jgi:hypothetical protein